MLCCSWSRNSRYVLTASKDWNVVVWDLASETDPPKRKTTVRFDASVTSAQFHPRNRYVPRDSWLVYYNSSESSQILLVLLGPGDAYVVDLRRQHRGRVELCELQDDSDDETQTSKSRFVYPFGNLVDHISRDSRSTMTVVHFDPSGKHIFAGTSTASVLVFNTRTKTVSTWPTSSSLLTRRLDDCKTQNCGGRYHKRPRVCKEWPVRVPHRTTESQR